MGSDRAIAQITLLLLDQSFIERQSNLWGHQVEPSLALDLLCSKGAKKSQVSSLCGGTTRRRFCFTNSSTPGNLRLFCITLPGSCQNHSLQELCGLGQPLDFAPWRHPLPWIRWIEVEVQHYIAGLGCFGLKISSKTKWAWWRKPSDRQDCFTKPFLFIVFSALLRIFSDHCLFRASFRENP